MLLSGSERHHDKIHHPKDMAWTLFDRATRCNWRVHYRFRPPAPLMPSACTSQRPHRMAWPRQADESWARLTLRSRLRQTRTEMCHQIQAVEGREFGLHARNGMFVY